MSSAHPGSRSLTCLYIELLPSHILASQGERNYIMQVICESTQSANPSVQVKGYECLVKIMQLYYDKMRFYMERALFGVSQSKA